MGKPVAILDPHWRRRAEIFAPAEDAALAGLCSLVWARDEPMPHPLFEQQLAEATFLLSATPVVGRKLLASAPRLKAIIELGGAFPEGIDYAACAERGVEVLCCAPGFRRAVAEMALGLILAGARGIVRQHEAFRAGAEQWVEDCEETDFSLFGATVGFIGLGSIAREIVSLMKPFAPEIVAYDPWLPPEAAAGLGVELAGLDSVLSRSRCLVVAAAPSRDNCGLIGSDELSRLRRGALVVLISRAHLVDFPALEAAVRAGHLRAAIDVFPAEPVEAHDPVRTLPDVILSPHRAAAVAGGRHPIGRMIVEDIRLMLAGQMPKNLQRAATSRIEDLAGVQSTARIATMAATRRATGERNSTKS